MVDYNKKAYRLCVGDTWSKPVWASTLKEAMFMLGTMSMNDVQVMRKGLWTYVV